MDSQARAVEVSPPIHPRSVKGRFRNLKYVVLALAYGIYFGLPWLRWARDNGPDQAVLFDLEGRRFYLFDLIVHPQDIFWLAGFLTIAALLLFFVTGVAGRVFCGYFCFQTLWTDIFMRVERWVQGERPARLRLEKQSWNGQKIARKGLTHLIWLAIALATGISFTLYWGDAADLTVRFFTGDAPFPMYATSLFLMATTYTMAGLARENVCFHMCPYSRFQSAMFDHDTLIVSYDPNRGEGKSGRSKLGRGKKTQEERREQGLGDCVDCGYCVQVCPVGIDIRDGLQAQCIHCALCIDACDEIMDATGWPRGLIRYSSENELNGGKTRFFKFKTVGYGIALVVMTVVLMWSISNQVPLDLAIRQVRNPLFVSLSDGRIQNSYEVKINNKTTQEQTFDLTTVGLKGAEVDFGRLREIRIAPDGSLRFLVRIKMDKAGNPTENFNFLLASPTDEALRTSKPGMFYRGK